MAVTPEPQYAATGASAPTPRAVEPRPQLCIGKEPAHGVGVVGEGCADRAGDVAGHRVDRLVLAAEALAGADVDQHAVAGGGRRIPSASTTGS